MHLEVESPQNIVGFPAFHSEMGLTQLPPVLHTFRCLGQKSENVFEKSNILIGMAFGPCGFTLLFPLIFMLVTICSEKCSRCFVYTCTILTNLILIALSFLLYSQDQKIA